MLLCFRRYPALIFNSLLRVAVPAALVFFIFSTIDTTVFAIQFFGADIPFIAFALCIFPLTIAIAVTRWHALVKAVLPVPPRWRVLFWHYYAGLGIGYFVPAGVGLDAYRTLAVRSAHGNLARLATIVVFERFLALASCVLLFAAIYPFAKPLAFEQSQGLDVFARAAYACVALVVFLTGIFVLIRFSIRTSPFSQWLEAVTARKINSFIKKFPDSARAENAAKSMHSCLSVLLTPGILLRSIALSLTIQIAGAVAVWVIFHALSAPLPFLVPLLATPIVFVAVHLPISFGGLGVRESVFILFYGLYDVSPETALAAALFTLAGSLMNVLLGGGVIAIKGTYRSESPPGARNSRTDSDNL